MTLAKFRNYKDEAPPASGDYLCFYEKSGCGGHYFIGHYFSDLYGVDPDIFQNKVGADGWVERCEDEGVFGEAFCKRDECGHDLWWTELPDRPKRE